MTSTNQGSASSVICEPVVQTTSAASNAASGPGRLRILVVAIASMVTGTGVGVTPRRAGIHGRSVMEAVRGPVRAAGRVALAAMFITGGADAVFDPGPRAPKAAEIGVPLDPELAVRANGAAMLGAGVALALGVRPRLAAAVLAGTLVPTTLAGHPYWKVEDPAMRRQQRTHFFKNVGLLGGTLLVLSERRRGAARPRPRGRSAAGRGRSWR